VIVGEQWADPTKGVIGKLPSGGDDGAVSNGRDRWRTQVAAVGSGFVGVVGGLAVNTVVVKSAWLARRGPAARPPCRRPGRSTR
jgi:hypothetical protein